MKVNIQIAVIPLAIPVLRSTAPLSGIDYYGFKFQMHVWVGL
jgi:hypothetical protein